MSEGKSYRRYLPFALVSACYLTLIGISLGFILKTTGGVFVYGLDDAYIHLSIARSLRLHGEWGLDGTGFVSASSSLIWPPLVALASLLLGQDLWAPFLLNILCSLLALWVANEALPAESLSERGRVIALFVFMLLSPLPILTFTGMEHTLQIAATLLFAGYAARFVGAASREVRGRQFAILISIALLCTLIRYESLFLVAAVCLLLLLSKRWLAAIVLAIVAWIPAAGFGLYSRAHGWFFFPNSLMMKGAPPLTGVGADGANAWDYFLGGVKELIFTFLSQFVVTPSLLFIFVALCILSAFLARRGLSWRSPQQSLAIIFAVALIEHMLLGSVDGAVYRYEAYLVGIGWISLVELWTRARAFQARGASPVWFQSWRIALCLVLFFGPRVLVATVGTPLASRGIFEQQYQMAEFLRKYYPYSTVAANDIGLLNYAGNVKVFDLFGLADIEIATLKRKGEFSTEAIEEIASRRQVQLAVVYEDWFNGYGGLPKRWIKAGEWTVPFTFVCGGPTVAFYALEKTEADHLEQALRAFHFNLPSWVTVIY